MHSQWFKVMRISTEKGHLRCQGFMLVENLFKDYLPDCWKQEKKKGVEKQSLCLCYILQAIIQATSNSSKPTYSWNLIVTI